MCLSPVVRGTTAKSRTAPTGHVESVQNRMTWLAQRLPTAVSGFSTALVIDGIVSIGFISRKRDASSSWVMKIWNEKRHHRREPVNISAVAVMDGGLTRRPVSVINLSRTGAQIEVSWITELPPTLTLLFDNRLEPCELIWQASSFAGLRFIDAGNH